MSVSLRADQARLCPLCGERGVPRLVSEARIDEAQLTALAFASRKPPEYMHHRLVCCQVCRLVYADPAPSAETLAAAYQQADFDSQEEAAHASRTYGRLVDQLLPRLPNRTGALDIGTGDGSFLAELVRRGFSGVAGVEPSAAPIAQADPAVRPLIHHGVFRPGLHPPASLSLVTCLQTIEHLPDPLGVCRDAATMLRPGGALLLVGHNREALSARVLGERSPIYDIEHLQLFSPRSATVLLERAGLVDVSVRPLTNRYPLAYWARLFPLPSGLKAAVTGRLDGGRVGRWELPLRAGNMVMVGFRAR